MGTETSREPILGDWLQASSIQHHPPSNSGREGLPQTRHFTSSTALYRTLLCSTLPALCSTAKLLVHPSVRLLAGNRNSRRPSSSGRSGGLGQPAQLPSCAEHTRKGGGPCPGGRSPRSRQSPMEREIGKLTSTPIVISVAGAIALRLL